MTTGKAARMKRIGRDGKFVTVPMDHGITLGPVTGLKDIESTIDAVTRGGADAVLTQKGIATRVHDNKNAKGFIVHLNASTTIGPDSDDKRLTGTVEEAVRAGADAVSFHINVGSKHEPDQIAELADVADDADRLGMPLLAMAYARGDGIDEHDAENLGHAVRLAEEVGADIVKTAYSGDAESFEHVCEATRLPVIIAGGSPDGDSAALGDVRGAMDAGGAGVSMGRSIFQHDDPYKMAKAVAAVVHDDATADEAITQAGLAVEV